MKSEVSDVLLKSKSQNNFTKNLHTGRIITRNVGRLGQEGMLERVVSKEGMDVRNIRNGRAWVVVLSPRKKRWAHGTNSNASCSTE